MVVRDDGSSFAPLLLLLGVDNAIQDGEIAAKAPFVSCAEGGGNGGLQVFADVEWSEVRHRLEEFRRMPCVEGA